jgi:chemotaxis protein MotB
MKRFMGSLLALGLLAGGMLAGGCVSKDDYDKLMAQNRNAQSELERCQELLRTLRAQNEKLAQDLANRDATNAEKLRQYDLLVRENERLKKELDDLNKKIAGMGGSSGPVAINPLPDRTNKALQALADKYPGLLRFHPESGMVEFMSDLTFDKGSDQVSAKAKEALAKFVEIVNSPEAAKFAVFVAGHTDDIRIAKPETKERHPTNWYLSVHRSVAVEEVLAAAGLAESRIGTMGFSEFRPAAPNAPNKAGNAANRRVELWIVQPSQFVAKPATSQPQQ